MPSPIANPNPFLAPAGPARGGRPVRSLGLAGGEAAPPRATTGEAGTPRATTGEAGTPRAAAPSSQAPAAPTAPAAPAPTAPARSPREALVQARFADGVARIQKKIRAEEGLPLQQGCRSKLYAAGAGARGTVVMYHGFSAGTWQFEAMAKRFREDGYNVYLPRLPGHGFKRPGSELPHVVEDGSKLIKANEPARYAAFADETLADARALGVPVTLVGLSVGGDLALDAAERHPDEVARVVAYAPFVRPPGPAWLYEAAHWANKFTFGLVGKIVDLIPWGWGRETEEATAKGQRMGHAKFSLGTIFAVGAYGREVMTHADRLSMPVQFFATDSDDAVSQPALRKTFEASGGVARHGWYRYPSVERVPHPMVAQEEANGSLHVPGLQGMTLAFVERGQEAQRP